MESGGESEGPYSLKKDNLEVSISVEDLKLLLGRLGDFEDPYFKHLEVIKETGCVWQNGNLTEKISRKRLIFKVTLIKRRLAAVR